MRIHCVPLVRLDIRLKVLRRRLLLYGRQT